MYKKSTISKCWWLQEGTLGKLTIVLHVHWMTVCNLCIAAHTTRVRSHVGVTYTLSLKVILTVQQERAVWKWGMPVFQQHIGIRAGPGVLMVEEMILFLLTRDLRPYSLGLAFSLLLSYTVYCLSPTLMLSVLGPHYAWINPILRSSVCEPRKTDLWTWGNCEVQFPGPWLKN